MFTLTFPPLEDSQSSHRTQRNAVPQMSSAINSKAKAKKKRTTKKSQSKRKGKGKKKKRKRDPNRPKKALTPFMVYSMNTRVKLKSDHPSWDFGRISAATGKGWRAMKEADKKEYIKAAIKIPPTKLHYHIYN